MQKSPFSLRILTLRLMPFLVSLFVFALLRRDRRVTTDLLGQLIRTARCSLLSFAKKPSTFDNE